MDNVLLTVEEAAELLRVPVSTLRHWIQIGEAPSSARIGRRRYLRRDDCLAWVDAKFAGDAR